MRTHLFALLLVSSSLPMMASPAVSQQQPTQAELAACMPDFKKLCSGVQPGGGRVLACLAKQKDQLAPDCRAVVDKHGG